MLSQPEKKAWNESSYMNGYNRESTHSASYVIPAIASEVLFCYAYAVVRCPSVRLSVMFVYSIEMNKYSFKIFSPSTSHTVFHTKRYDNITTETPTWRKKIAIFDQSLALAPITTGPSCVVSTSWSTLHHPSPRSTNAATPRVSEYCLWQKTSTLHRRQQNIIRKVNLKPTQLNYTVFQKSKATRCLIITLANVDRFPKFFHQVSTRQPLGTNYWQTWSIARPLCDSRASMFH